MMSEPASMLAHKMRKLSANAADHAAIEENIRQLMHNERTAWASKLAGNSDIVPATLQSAHCQLVLVPRN